MDVLDCISDQGIIQSYGIQMNFPPYCYHTPPAASESSLLSFAPLILEYEVRDNHPFADLIAYTISPTHHTPATYCCLPSSSDIAMSDGRFIVCILSQGFSEISDALNLYSH
jgi:hypothetical protein